MLYLVLGADTMGIPLHEEGEPASSSWPFELPEQLKNDVINWNDRFSPLIAAEHLYSPEERKSLGSTLNEEGRQLASRIAAEMPGGAKVRYLAERM
jgi:hypothetical protein